MHMQWGGGLSGFIATRDEKEFVAEYPSLLFGITTTTKEGNTVLVKSSMKERLMLPGKKEKTLSEHVLLYMES